MKRYEIIHFPEYRKFTSDRKSNIIFDVTTSGISEIDDLTLEILQKWLIDEDEDAFRTRFLVESDDVPETMLDSSLRLISEHEEYGSLLQSREITWGYVPPDELDIGVLTLNLSERCQLACKYCFAGGGSYGSEMPVNMTQKVAFAAIDLLKKHGRKSGVNIGFFGGEPLLNWQVMKSTVEYAEIELAGIVDAISFNMTTNGIAITEEIAEFISQRAFSVMFSIDGSEEIHNELRPARGERKCTWGDTMRGLEICLKANIPTTVRPTITPQSESLSEMVDLFVKYGVKSINFQPLCSIETNMSLNHSELQAFTKQLCELSERKDIHIPLVEGFKRRIHSRYMSVWHCGLGSGGIVISPSGNVYPCHRFVGERQFESGNVLNGLNVEKLLGYRRDLHIKDIKGCRSCWMRYLCTGSCYAENNDENQELKTPNSNRCYINKTLIVNSIEWLLKLYQHTENDGVAQEIARV